MLHRTFFPSPGATGVVEARRIPIPFGCVDVCAPCQKLSLARYAILALLFGLLQHCSKCPRSFCQACVQRNLAAVRHASGFRHPALQPCGPNMNKLWPWTRVQDQIPQGQERFAGCPKCCVDHFFSDLDEPTPSD